MSRPEFRVKVTLKATLSPSEDPAKVALALKNVLYGEEDEVEVGEGSASLSTEDIKTFTRIKEQLRDRHVRSAARRQLLLNSSGRRTSMMLNRQAAAAGVVAVCGTPDESPLGPICATVESDDLEAAIDWLTAYGDR